MLIQRIGPVTDKNADMVKVLVRASPSYSSSAISSLLGVTKDDTCKSHRGWSQKCKSQFFSFSCFTAGLTSCGLTVRTLQKCAAYTTGSSLILLAAPPTSGGRGNLFGMQSGQVSKALCHNLCFSISSGKFLSLPDLQPSSQLHCALSKGASMSTMG